MAQTSKLTISQEEYEVAREWEIIRRELENDVIQQDKLNIVITIISGMKKS